MFWYKVWKGKPLSKSELYIHTSNYSQKEPQERLIKFSVECEFLGDNFFASPIWFIWDSSQRILQRVRPDEQVKLNFV